MDKARLAFSRVLDERAGGVKGHLSAAWTTLENQEQW